MYLVRNKPVGHGYSSSHRGGADEYGAVDIGGVLDFPALTAVIQQAISRLPAHQQVRAGENWGYSLKVHVTEGTASEAVVVRPYPYKTWGWR